jgi:hypothetical protein
MGGGRTITWTAAGGQIIAIHTEYSTGTGARTLTERLSYDPWGKRHNATTNAWLSLSPGSNLLSATLAAGWPGGLR